MPFRLVELGPSISPILPVRKGILALRPTQRTINIGGSRLNEPQQKSRPSTTVTTIPPSDRSRDNWDRLVKPGAVHSESIELRLLMRAIVYSQTGGPDVLRLVERSVPVTAVGQVRVRVHISGVNPTDWKSRR